MSARDRNRRLVMDKEEIQKLVEEFLKRLGVEFSAIEIVENSMHPIISVRTENAGVLIGNRGEHLHAINHIVRKMLEQKGIAQDTHFMVDVNNYHSKHIKTLENAAQLLAERARTFKYDIEMSPMNAYDRMIVHAFLSNDPDLSTESQGEGAMRRVVIRYKKLNEGTE